MEGFEQKVFGYCDGVLDGTILACNTVVQAVERFYRDLENQDEFHYDAQAGEFSCDFFAGLLNHSIGEMNGKPFILEPWQCFINFQLFAWKRRSDDTRRFRRAHVSVARKNGKSTWCSGLALYLAIADDEPGAQVFIGATKKDQAKIIFEECRRMLQASPSLYESAEITKENIAFEFNNSFIRPVSSDKPFDGLNPHAVFFDELHAWAEHHRKFYETMTTGSGGRTQPLQMSITTAGDDRSNLYLEESNYIRSILKQEFDDEETFGIIYELDEGDDEFNLDLYVKSNPNFGVSVKPDYLEQQIKEAQQKPQRRNTLIRYHGNRLVSSVQDAFSPEDWRNATRNYSDWREALCVCAGFDLGGEDDLAAYGLCAKFSDGVNEQGEQAYRYEIRSRSFINEHTRRDLTKEPFNSWIQLGQITSVRYVTESLKTALLEECNALGVSKIAYDPYNARQLGEELEQHGLCVFKMPQNTSQFNEPIRTFSILLKQAKVTHDGQDKVLVWAAGNASIVTNSAGFSMFDKKSSKDKIDPIVAVMMAYRAATLEAEAATGSLFIG